MGHRKTKSHTLPSSPIHHHSLSSDFEFTVSLSPRKSTTTNLRPADELFYKGQLLPLHLSPRNSMVRTLLLTSNTITARHSSDYQSSFSYATSDSSRPSSATDDDDTHFPQKLFDLNSQTRRFMSRKEKKVMAGKQFSFNRFSSVFRKETKPTTQPETAALTSSSVKEKIRNYLKKVKPLYEKLSVLQGQKTKPTPMAKNDDLVSPSFAGNLRFFRRTSCVSSCPSTMPSSPNHSGVLCRRPINSSSSTEELQSAIQGAIAHCKNSMTQTAWNHK